MPTDPDADRPDEDARTVAEAYQRAVVALRRVRPLTGYGTGARRLVDEALGISPLKAALEEDAKDPRWHTHDRPGWGPKYGHGETHFHSGGDEVHEHAASNTAAEGDGECG